LKGVKVLEVAIFAFAPSAGVILTDWGAEVLKIEHATAGDPQRDIAAWGVPAQVDGIAHLFEVANRGKRSMGLDISTPEGHAILMRLVDEIDVFVTNFLPAARRKLRIEPEDVLGRNPRVVYARGSAQGPRGESAERGGFDSISYWGRSGAAIGVTPPESPWPLTMPGPGFGDLQSGMALAGAIAAGLYQRERTGRGPVVDVSLMSVGLWAMGMTISGTSVLGTDTLPHLYHDTPENPVVNMYRTKDDRLIFLGFLQADRYWPAFCRAVGRDDLLTDARFVDTGSRQKYAEACVEILQGIFAERTFDEWATVLDGHGGQWDVVLPAGQVKDDSQVRANGYVGMVSHDGGGQIALVGAPAQFDGEAPTPGKAPRLGSHTDETLQRLGLTPDQIADLRARGVVG
jgi:crotonobetainyl-CoA:carnitine CoA-transferase CaiB-like acyl-CoA transferase